MVEPGRSFCPGIAVAANAAGQLELFAVRRDSYELWHAHQTANNSTDWTAWSSLGGALQGPVAVVQHTNGLLHVFGVAIDTHAVRHRWQTRAPDSWADWADLGGTLLPGLAAIRNRDGRIELFGLGAASNTLLHCWQRAPAPRVEWSEWASLGGSFLPGFAVGQNGLGHVEVFAINKVTHNLQRTYQLKPGSSAEWAPWHDFGRSVAPIAGDTTAPPPPTEPGLPETETTARGSADMVHPKCSGS